MKRLSIFITGVLLLLTLLHPSQVIASEIGIENLPPKLVVESYKITEGQLTPDKEFHLKLTIKNTNKTVAAENIMLTYSTMDAPVYPVYGRSNQCYIGKINGGEKKEVNLTMKVGESIKTEIATLSLTLDYSSKNANNVTDNSTISLPVSSNCSMSVNSLSVAKSSTMNSKSLVSVDVVNTGLVEIKNITMKIQGDILDEQKEMVLGDLTAGAQLAKDCYVNFQKEGTQEVKISFTYENQDGTLFEVPESSYTTIVGPEILQNSSIEASSDEVVYDFTELEIWQWMILAAGVVLIILILVITIHHKKKRRF